MREHCCPRKPRIAPLLALVDIETKVRDGTSMDRIHYARVLREQSGHEKLTNLRLINNIIPGNKVALRKAVSTTLA